MYATVRHYTDPELSEQLRARADEVAAVVSGIPGFDNYFLIHGDDGTISVTVYDSEESAKAAKLSDSSSTPCVRRSSIARTTRNSIRPLGVAGSRRMTDSDMTGRP